MASASFAAGGVFLVGGATLFPAEREMMKYDFLFSVGGEEISRARALI